MIRRALPVALLLATSACDASPEPAAAACSAMERRPVLFVHGSGLNSGSWSAMRDELARRGYPRDWLQAIDLKPDDGDNVRAAEKQIAPAAAALLRASADTARKSECRPPAKLDIVAHSMGAVSSRWYVARMAPQTVHTWIGIAAANHGTDALCGHAGEGNRQMCPAYSDRGVQVELNGTRGEPRDETPFGLGTDLRAGARVAPDAGRAIRYFTVRIDPDEWIKPADSALLDGAGDGVMRAWPAGVRETTPGNLLAQGGPHDGLPFRGEIIEIVDLLLAGRMP